MKDRTRNTVAYLLRHDPAETGLVRDRFGWARLDDMLVAMAGKKHPVTREELIEIALTDKKGRYQLDLENDRIRAIYGHTQPVELDFEAETPPARLYHGTAVQSLPSILRQGLLPRARQYVHLSSEIAIACEVGSRHGTLALLSVDTEAMHRDGYRFYHPVSHTWLTEHVPPQYLSRAELPDT